MVMTIRRYPISKATLAHSQTESPRSRYTDSFGARSLDRDSTLFQHPDYGIVTIEVSLKLEYWNHLILESLVNNLYLTDSLLDFMVKR